MKHFYSEWKFEILWVLLTLLIAFSLLALDAFFGLSISVVRGADSVLGVFYACVSLVSGAALAERFS